MCVLSEKRSEPLYVTPILICRWQGKTPLCSGIFLPYSDSQKEYFAIFHLAQQFTKWPLITGSCKRWDWIYHHHNCQIGDGSSLQTVRSFLQISSGGAIWSHPRAVHSSVSGCSPWNPPRQLPVALGSQHSVQSALEGNEWHLKLQWNLGAILRWCLHRGGWPKTVIIC